MNLFRPKAQKKTAGLARDRLQLILINSSRDGIAPDFLPALHKELIEVISRYVKVQGEDIKIHVDRQNDLDVLEVKIEVPGAGGAPA